MTPPPRKPPKDKPVWFLSYKGKSGNYPVMTLRLPGQKDVPGARWWAVEGGVSWARAAGEG